VSWRETSKEELDKIIPVRPPKVNKNKKPNTHKTQGVLKIFVPYIVISHLKILIPVGIAIIMVAAVK
jgi:hypothetical protein